MLMNVQKIFDALELDHPNPRLRIICAELESQGYSVSINEAPVISDGFILGAHENFEEPLTPLNFSLFRNGVLEQEFAVEFVDFHEIVLRKVAR
jgi:hypothetical protein